MPDNTLISEDFIIDPTGRQLAGRWIKSQNPNSKNPVIVMLHEGLGAIPMWKGFPQKLALATGYDILIYDRQGYGGSPALSEARDTFYSHRYALEELPDVLEFCGIKKPILFGHSDGASIALIHAAHHPVTAIISEAAHVFVEEISLAGIREATEIWHTTDLPKRLERYHGDKTTQIFFAWSDTWQHPDFRDWNILDELANITCPSLIIQGVEDEYGSPEQVYSIKEKVTGPCETLLIPDCQHIPHFQAEDTVLKASVNFLNSIS